MKAEDLINKHLELEGGSDLAITDGRIYNAFLNALNEAINYTPCCETLKEQEIPKFEEYLKLLGWEQISSSYVYKQGRNYRDIADLNTEYHKKYNL